MKPCSKCGKNPVRGANQRYCRECHAVAMRATRKIEAADRLLGRAILAAINDPDTVASIIADAARNHTKSG